MNPVPSSSRAEWNGGHKSKDGFCSCIIVSGRKSDEVSFDNTEDIQVMLVSDEMLKEVEAKEILQNTKGEAEACPG